MQRCLLVTAVALIAMGWTTDVRAEETPQELIARAVKAHGGKDKMAQFKAVRTTTEGTTWANGFRANFTSKAAAQVPGQMRNELTVNISGAKITSIQVLNGDKAWVRVLGGYQDVTDAVLAEMKETMYAANVESLTPLLEENTYTLTALASRDIRDRTALGIRVASKGHPDIDLYFDKETGLLLMNKRKSLDANGRPVTLETYYKEFKDFDGLKVATLVTLYHDGSKVLEGRVKDIRFLDKLEDSEFAKP